MASPLRPNILRIGIRLSLAVLSMLAAGCLEVDMNDPNVRDAIKEVNKEFGAAYEILLKKRGAMRSKTDPKTAINTMENILKQLGFSVRYREGDHYLHVSAPAPSPLDSGEWKMVRQTDEPLIRKIAVKHIGIRGNFAKLEPQGLEINGYVTFTPVEDGVDIRITMRMVETEPQSSDSLLPRREYPPPHAARIAFEKIWRNFASRTSPLTRVAHRP